MSLDAGAMGPARPDQVVDARSDPPGRRTASEPLARVFWRGQGGALGPLAGAQVDLAWRDVDSGELQTLKRTSDEQGRVLRGRFRDRSTWP